jgi:hypothetical protein
MYGDVKAENEEEGHRQEVPAAGGGAAACPSPGQRLAYCLQKRGVALLQLQGGVKAANEEGHTQEAPAGGAVAACASPGQHKAHCPQKQRVVLLQLQVGMEAEDGELHMQKTPVNGGGACGRDGQYQAHCLQQHGVVLKGALEGPAQASVHCLLLLGRPACRQACPGPTRHCSGDC